jgi:hypothetical protein
MQSGPKGRVGVQNAGTADETAEAEHHVVVLFWEDTTPVLLKLTYIRK